MTVWTTYFVTLISQGKLRTFDLTRILRAIRPYKGGIAFIAYSGMHAVEDYIVSVIKCICAYFTQLRGMEVVKSFIKTRFQAIPLRIESITHPTFLKPFFEGTWTLEDYSRRYTNTSLTDY